MEHRLSSCVLTHSISFDSKFLAISDSSSSIKIFSKGSDPFSHWRLIQTLSGHDGLVTSISFHPSSHRFVSCSEDRNAYVWSLSSPSDPSSWVPHLVITKLSQAALFASWSPDGSKFAIASGARVVSVCTFDSANDWWVSSLIKKHRSSVTSLTWHPNSVIIATSCCDYRLRVFSTYKPELDMLKENEIREEFGEEGLEFGKLLGYCESEKSWVENGRFSPDGKVLVWSTFDRGLYSVETKEFKEKKGERVMVEKNEVLKEKGMGPVNAIEFVDDGKFVGSVGNVPVLFSVSDKDKGVEVLKVLHPKKKIERKVETEIEKKTAVLEAKLSYELSKKEFDDLKYCGENHSNVIASVEVNKKEKYFSTGGLDGRVVEWKFEDYA